MVRLSRAAAALLLLTPLGTGSSQAASVPVPVRWMPLGDSITDYGCWRARVWARLRSEAGYDVDLVGGETAGETCAGFADFDRNHEGHPGITAVEMATKKQLVGWLAKNPADVVTVHLGTNDLLRGVRRPPEVVTALDTLVDQMRASNPVMRIIVRPSPSPPSLRSDT